MEQGCVFLTSLKAVAGEKRTERQSERGEFMLMEWFKRQRVRVKGNGGCRWCKVWGTRQVVKKTWRGEMSDEVRQRVFIS